MHNRTAALLLVLPVSCVVAALVLPADPWHWFLLTMAIFGVSIACYFVGKRHGRAELDPTVDADAGRGRRRLQFSLGALLGLTTLVACLVAEVKWRHQIESQELRQANDRGQLSGKISSIIEQAPGNAPILYGGPAGESDGRAAYDSGRWVVDCGGKTPDAFLDTIVVAISDWLGKFGAEPSLPSRTGIGQSRDPGPFCARQGNEIRVRKHERENRAAICALGPQKLLGHSVHGSYDRPLLTIR